MAGRSIFWLPTAFLVTQTAYRNTIQSTVRIGSFFTRCARVRVNKNVKKVQNRDVYGLISVPCLVIWCHVVYFDGGCPQLCVVCSEVPEFSHPQLDVNSIVSHIQDLPIANLTHRRVYRALFVRLDSQVEVNLCQIIACVITKRTNLCH